MVKCNLALNVFFGVLWDFRNGVGVFIIVVAVRGWGAAKTGVGLLSDLYCWLCSCWN